MTLSPEESRARREDRFKSDPVFLTAEIEKWKKLIAKTRGRIRGAEKKGNDEFAGKLRALLPGLEEDLAHMRSLQHPNGQTNPPVAVPIVITNAPPKFTSPTSTLPPDQVDAGTEAAFKNVLTVAGGFLLIKDFVPLKVCLAAVVASQVRHEPVWILLVQPPSSLKTEFIRALNELICVHYESQITSSTLMSGKDAAETASGEEPSLLMSLNGVLLTLKDFTTALTMKPDQRDKIFAQLREIGDGHYPARWGTGKVCDWKGYLGILAGVTDVVDDPYYRNVLSSLGERFMQIRWRSAGRREVARQALRSMVSGKKEEQRRALAQAVENWFANVKLRPVQFSPEQESLICCLADLTTHLRTSVKRSRMNQAIAKKPQKEGPARLAQQLAAVVESLALAQGRATVNDEDIEAAIRVAISSMPVNRRLAMFALARIPEGQSKTLEDLAKLSRTPESILKNGLADLLVFGFVKRFRRHEEGEAAGPGAPYCWSFTKYAREIFTESRMTQAKLDAIEEEDENTDLDSDKQPSDDGAGD
jgi:hypothetical protein